MQWISGTHCTLQRLQDPIQQRRQTNTCQASWHGQRCKHLTTYIMHAHIPTSTHACTRIHAHPPSSPIDVNYTGANYTDPSSVSTLTDHAVPVIVYVRSGSPAVPHLRGPCGRILLSPLTQRVEDRTSGFVQSVSHDGVTYLGVNTCRCSVPQILYANSSKCKLCSVSYNYKTK